MSCPCCASQGLQAGCALSATWQSSLQRQAAVHAGHRLPLCPSMPPCWAVPQAASCWAHEQSLVLQVRETAAKAGVSLGGENALPCFSPLHVDSTALERVVYNSSAWGPPLQVGIQIHQAVAVLHLVHTSPGHRQEQRLMCLCVSGRMRCKSL